MRVLALLACVFVAGCATVTIDKSLYEAKSVALASIYAKKSIAFENMPVAPVLGDNELGAEVMEMDLGDTEARLGELFGVDVVPAGKAMQQKAYADLPEAWPPQEWTRVNDMTPVDVDAAAAPPALGALAHALGVDAVIVVRHEWVLARDRFEVNEGVTAFDRCALLVVDAKGHTLWDDSVVVRVPVNELSTGTFAVGFNGGTWADEARQLARRTSREALDALERRYRAARPKPGS